MEDNYELLTSAEVAGILKLKARTLESWRARKVGPPFIVFSRKRVRYRKVDLVSWIDKKRIETQL